MRCPRAMKFEEYSWYPLRLENGRAFPNESGNFAKTGKVKGFDPKYWKNQKKLNWKIENNTGKVREICQSEKVGTMQYCTLLSATKVWEKSIIINLKNMHGLMACLSSTKNEFLRFISEFKCPTESFVNLVISKALRFALISNEVFWH